MLSKVLVTFDYTLLKDSIDEYNAMMLQLFQFEGTEYPDGIDQLLNDPTNNIIQYMVDMIFVHETSLEEIIQDFLVKAHSAIDRLILDAHEIDDITSFSASDDEPYTTFKITVFDGSTSDLAEAKEYLYQDKSVYTLLTRIYEVISIIPREVILEEFNLGGVNEPDIYSTNVKIKDDSLYIYFYLPPECWQSND